MKHFSVLAPTLLAFLLACNGTPSPVLKTTSYLGGNSFEQVQTVTIDMTDTPEDVSERTGSTILSWHPEDGYAMIGLHNAVGLTGANNANAYTIPESSQAQAVWQEGWSVWGSGWNVWGSGWTVWGSGDTNNLPGQNAQIWQKIKLFEASKLAPNAGNGIKIAVIDSGIDLNHPAFTGSLVDSSDMWDWVDADGIPQDEPGSGVSHGYGHGTAVSGIILQIAPKAKIMPLRVLDPTGGGDTANVVAAIDFAVKHGAKIINLSLGTSYDRSLDNIINSAGKAGVVVVASSGNTGDGNITYPASDSLFKGLWGEMCLGVGSSDLKDYKSSFSTYGMALEMTAIGERVSSPAPGSMMGIWSGTSMSAPMVSAGFALALGERSYKDIRKLSRTLTTSSDSLDWTNPFYIARLGYGRLNLERFLQTVLSPSFK